MKSMAVFFAGSVLGLAVVVGLNWVLFVVLPHGGYIGQMIFHAMFTIGIVWWAIERSELWLLRRARRTRRPIL